MGIGGTSIWQLLFILIIVLLVFGTKKLRNMGSDLGGAIRGFKDAIDKDKAESEGEVGSSSANAESTDQNSLDEDAGAKK